jgi:hypothetical protein
MIGVTVVERTRILREIYGKVVGNECNVSSMYRSEEEIMWSKVGVKRIRGSQVIRPSLSIHFREIFRSKKSRAAI